MGSYNERVSNFGGGGGGVPPDEIIGLYKVRVSREGSRLSKTRNVHFRAIHIVRYIYRRGCIIVFLGLRRTVTDRKIRAIELLPEEFYMHFNFNDDTRRDVLFFYVTYPRLSNASSKSHYSGDSKLVIFQDK